MPQTRIALATADLVRRLPSVVPVLGLYAAGSLGTNDFQPDHSDLDLIAVLEQPPDAATVKALKKMHQALIKEHDIGERLHCLYVGAPLVDDRRWEWPYFAHGRMEERRFSAIERAELHDHGVVIAGEPVPQQIPYVTHEELIQDVRSALTDVWLPAASHRRRWLKDEWVDLGLTMLPRARAAIADGTLLSKSQAIVQLSEFGVPGWVRDDMLARRRGRGPSLSARQRRRRATLTREAVRRGSVYLLAAAAEAD